MLFWSVVISIRNKHVITKILLHTQMQCETEKNTIRAISVNMDDLYIFDHFYRPDGNVTESKSL